MGMETRIGIATGLLIVVVASVYFFFNRDRTEDDLLIAVGEKAEPPKIPAVADKEEEKKKVLPDTEPTVVRTKRRSTPANHERVASGADDERRKLQPYQPATRQRSRAQPSRGIPPKPTPLRSSPSPELVKATQDNLAKPNAPLKTAPNKTPQTPAEAKEGTETGADLATVSAKIRQARRSSAKQPAPRSAKHGTVAKSPARRLEKPPEVWPKRHRIDSGDTLSDISIQYYSTSLLVDHILQANPNISARHLKIGDILVIPAPKAKSAAPSPQPRTVATGASDVSPSRPSGTKTYHVQKGDTFYSIAQKMLGSSSRWKEVYDRNRDVVNNDPKRLKPGMVLTLPG